MKVLHITHYPKGGIITVILNQIIHSKNPNIQYYFAVLGPINKGLYEVAQKDGISINFIVVSKFSIIGSLLGYYRLLKKISPDIIHTHSYFPRVLTGFLMLCKRMNKIRSVTTIHNEYPYFYNNDFKSTFKRFTEKIFIKYTDSIIICVSQGVKDAITQAFQNIQNICVINNGIYLTKKEDHPLWNKQSETCSVITVGRLSSQKNYRYLLDCWSEIVKKYPKATLWLVGDGEERPALEEKVKKLNIVSNVSFMGWQNNVYELLKKANIFVLSSIHEGFPTSILEALSQGLPVITTEVSGVNEIIENNCNGLIVPKDNKCAMVHALSRLIEDATLRQKLGKSGQSLVHSRFSIHNYIKKVEQLYLKILH